MKDFYALLGIAPGSTSEQVQAALDTSNGVHPSSRQAAEKVLLSPNRRKQYDRIRHTVHQIAHLRAVLNMKPGTELHPNLYLGFTPLSIRAKQPSAAAPGASARPKTPVTPKTHATLGTQKAKRAIELGAPPTLTQVVAVIVAGAVIWSVFVGFWPGLNTGTPQTPLQRPAQLEPVTGSSSSTPAAKIFDAPIQDLPATGDFDTAHSKTRNAIVVTTRGDRHTLIKIEKTDGNEVTTGFIRAGEAHTFNLPQGTYTIKIATGSLWYGKKLLFGPDTNFSKADDTFPLNAAGEQWTVELIPQTDGNLREVSLRPDQF